MDVEKLINKNLVKMDLQSTEKKEVLREMIGLFTSEDKITSEDDFFETILAREKEGTTGLGRGIAIQHGKSEVVNELTLAFGRSEDGIEYNSLDGRPVHLVFMVADYKGYSPGYLKMVSKLVSKLRVDEYRESLMAAENEAQVVEIIKEIASADKS